MFHLILDWNCRHPTTNPQRRPVVTQCKIIIFLFISRSKVPQPGKLRVRCSVCREGAVVVLADPCSWEDVLQPRRIQGQCQNSLCPESCLLERFFSIVKLLVIKNFKNHPLLRLLTQAALLFETNIFVKIFYLRVLVQILQRFFQIGQRRILLQMPRPGPSFWRQRTSFWSPSTPSDSAEYSSGLTLIEVKFNVNFLCQATISLDPHPKVFIEGILLQYSAIIYF